MENKLILTTPDEVERWLENSASPKSFDWETTGVNYLEMEPVGVSFHDGKTAVYINLWNNPEKHLVLDVLADHFQHGVYVAHNAKFDLKCTRKFCGVDVPSLYCTYIASFLLDENAPSHSLKELAVTELGVTPRNVMKWEESSGHGYTSKQWFEYCHNDAIWTYQLWMKQQPLLVEQGLWYLYTQVEMPFVHVCADMEIHGVKVDMAKLEQLDKRCKEYLHELEDKMAELAGIKIFLQSRMFGLETERVMSTNLRSPEQLRKILNKLGFKVKDCKKETILSLKGKHPFIDCLIDYKNLRKLYDAYITPTYSRIDGDGRIRCSFGIVKTGRTNCREPNLQQLPKLNKRFRDLDYRSIFVAEPGCSLFGGDYSGQELRVLGAVSNERNILDAFAKKYDLHLYTAKFIFDLPLSDNELKDGTPEHKLAAKKYESERHKAKNGVNFPIIYGSSEVGIAHNMGVSVQEAKSWQTKFFQLYPGVQQAMEATKSELASNGLVRTLMGRIRRFPNYDRLPAWAKGKKPSKARCVRQAFNFKIQGFSADQIKIASARARRMGLKVLLIVHDEIVCECDSNAAAGFARTLQQCMENAISLPVNFIAEVKIGQSYSELK